MADQLQQDLELQRMKRNKSQGRTLFQGLFGAAADTVAFLDQATSSPATPYHPGPLVQSLREVETKATPGNLHTAAGFLPNPFYRSLANNLVDLVTLDPEDPQQPQQQPQAPRPQKQSRPRPVSTPPYPQKGPSPMQRYTAPALSASTTPATAAVERSGNGPALVDRVVSNTYNPRNDVERAYVELRDIRNTPLPEQYRGMSLRDATYEATRVARALTMGSDDDTLKAVVARGVFNRLYAPAADRLKANTDRTQTVAQLASGTAPSVGQVATQGIATRGQVVNSANLQRRALVSNLADNETTLNRELLAQTGASQRTAMTQNAANDRLAMQALLGRVGGQRAGKSGSASAIKPVLNTTQDYKMAAKGDPQAKAVIANKLLNNMRLAATSGQPLPEQDKRLADNLTYTTVTDALNKATGGLFDSMFSGVNSKIGSLQSEIDPLYSDKTGALMQALGAELRDGRYIVFNGGRGGLDSESIPPIDLYELASEDPVAAEYLSAILRVDQQQAQ